jgi:hypothetical protein
VVARAFGAGCRREADVRRLPYRRGRLPAAASLLAAYLVDQAAGGDGHQPGPGAVRDALGRPLHRGREQRLLHRVLALLKPAIPVQEHAEDLRRQFTQQVPGAFGRAHISIPAESISGRTSTPPT